MWQNITSVFFLKNRDEEDDLDEIKFNDFLEKITGFIWAYAVTNPGVNALRTPIYDEMVNIVKGHEISFAKYKFKEDQTRRFFENFEFGNQRSITRSMLTWYAYTYSNQNLLDMKDAYHIEHIYARKRQDMERGLKSHRSIESLGNKVLLEESINIKASDYRFEDKKNIYSGRTRRGKNTKASQITEITSLCDFSDFTEKEILNRNKKILDEFFQFLRNQELIS
jgi:hypothetical protein